MTKKRLIIIVIITSLLLLIPFIGMQFSEEVNWNILDFAVAGILIMSAGVSINLIATRIQKKPIRIALIFLLIIIFVVVWLELAVGLNN